MKYHKDGTLPKDRSSILVFGSNLAGIHGAGAAKEAWHSYGAEIGKGVGLVGNSYAIPTKDKHINKVGIDQIKPYIQGFVLFTQKHTSMEFFVTRVGCGLAGHTDSEIAPLFRGCSDNCNMPEEWRKYLEEKNESPNNTNPNNR